MLKVKDEKGLVRDPSSKAVLNVDIEALREHRKKTQIFKKMSQESNKVETLEKMVQSQSFQIAELTAMVKSLLDMSKRQ